MRRVANSEELRLEQCNNTESREREGGDERRRETEWEADMGFGNVAAILTLSLIPKLR